MSDFESEDGAHKSSQVDDAWGKPPGAETLQASLRERDELWVTLIEAALGMGPGDAGYEERSASFWKILHAGDLSKEEHQLLALGHGTLDTRRPIDQLVEMRIRRALAAAYDCLPGMKMSLPHILLARGEEPLMHGGTLVRLSSGLAITLEEDGLDQAPGGTIVQLSSEERLELSQVIEEVEDGQEPDVLEELDQTYVGQALASSVGRESVHQALSELSSNEKVPALILTDQKGVDSMGGTVEVLAPGEALDLQPIPESSDFESKVSDSSRLRDSSGKTLRAISMGRPLNRLEQILLWSVESAEREQLLKRSLHGNLRGAVLGNKYEIEQQMGRGGFGTVYRARDRILDVKVAVKVLNPRIAKKKDALARFLAEAQRLTAADHPNIVRWITFDRTDDGLHYFVMEFLDGMELTDLIEAEGAIEPVRAGEILLQVLAALRSVHTLPGGSELLHLDLKPQNIFLIKGSEANRERAKVIDFGISRYSQDKREEIDSVRGASPIHPRGDTHGAGSSSTPVSGGSTVRRVLGGTVPYSSPEQCMHIIGEADIHELDGRTDIYSLGVIAFEMLTGIMPFPKPKSIQEAAINHIAIPPKKVLEVNKQVPRRLAEFVDKCLKKDPNERWASADEAHRALEAIVHPRSRLAGFVTAASILLASGALAWGVFHPSEAKAKEVGVLEVSLINESNGAIEEYDARINTIELREDTSVLLRVDSIDYTPTNIRILVDGPEGLGDDSAQTGSELEGVDVSWDEDLEEFQVDLATTATTAQIQNLGTGRLRWQNGDTEFETPVQTFLWMPSLEVSPAELELTLRTADLDAFIETWKGDGAAPAGLLLQAEDDAVFVLELPDPNQLADFAELKFTPQDQALSATFEAPEIYRLSRGDKAEFRFELDPSKLESLSGDVSLEILIRDRLGARLPIRGLAALNLQHRSMFKSERAGARLRLEGPGGESAQVVVMQEGGFQICLPEVWQGKLEQVDLVVDLDGVLNPVNRRLTFERGDRSVEGRNAMGWDGEARQLRVPISEFMSSGVLSSGRAALKGTVLDADLRSCNRSDVEYKLNVSLLFVRLPTLDPHLVGSDSSISMPLLTGDYFVLEDEPYSLTLQALHTRLNSESSWWVRARNPNLVGEGESQIARFDALEGRAQIDGLAWSIPGNGSLELEFFHAEEAASAADLEGRMPFKRQALEFRVVENEALQILLEGESVSTPRAKPGEEIERVLEQLMAEIEAPIEDREIRPRVLGVYCEQAPLESMSARLTSVRARSFPMPQPWRADSTGIMGVENQELALAIGAASLRTLRDGTYGLVLEAQDVVGRSFREERDIVWNRSKPEIRPKAGPTGGGDGKATWKPENGSYVLRVSATDGNGVGEVSARISLDGGRAWPLDKPTRESMDANGRDETLTLEWSFSFREEDSGRQGRVTISAADLEGKDNEITIEFKLGDRVTTSYARELSGIPGKDADTKMYLVSRPAGEFYEMARFDLQGDDGAKRSELLGLLEAAGVFYSEPGIFASMEEYQSKTGMPSRTIQRASMPGACYLDEHEVSIGQYRRFLEDPEGYGSEDFWTNTVGAPYPERESRCQLLKDWINGKADDLPMERVNVKDAWGYAKWAGKRLPTYMEWELGMRGEGARRLFSLEGMGIPPDDRTRSVSYNSPAGGGVIKTQAVVFAEVGDQGPVGIRSGLGPNAEGIYHLGGNVSEWTCSPVLVFDSANVSAWVTEVNGPFLIDPANAGDSGEWWVVGASYGNMSSTTQGTQLHDFRRSRSVFINLGSFPIGFRCAINAGEAQAILEGLAAPEGSDR